MEIEGHIYYQGCNYDDDGHCDDYDLMFSRCDTGEELCLNGFEDAIFPDAFNKDKTSFTSPLSVHDKIRGLLKLEFVPAKEK